MGFLINTITVPSIGMECKNVYVTIKGKYNVEKTVDSRIFYNVPPTSPSLATADWYMFSSNNYLVINPLWSGRINVEFDPDGLSNQNVHNLIYDSLKTKFAGDGVIFTDD